MDSIDLINLKNRVAKFKEISQNTHQYRKAWDDGLAKRIIDTLESICLSCEINSKVEKQEPFQNLSAIILSLGTEASGISERINENTARPLIKNNGSLIYQQLFNGKIQVMISYPYIEGFGDPKTPKMIAIYRPEELKEPFFIRHMEELLKEVTAWEDYDDDLPQKIGFSHNAMPVQQ